MTIKQLLTAEQVAEILGLDVFTIWKLGREGALPRVMVGPRTVRFDPDDVQAYINGRRQGRPVDWNAEQEIPF